MPRYCYTCPQCGEKLEVTLQVTDPDPKCPNCQSDLERDYAAEGGATPHFKGSGFYATDYE